MKALVNIHQEIFNMSLNIVIDCVPGGTRPNFYFKQILNEFISDEHQELAKFSKNYLQQNPDCIPSSTLFGNWTWNITLNKNESIHITIFQEKFSKQLTNLYNNGAIRYASW